MTSAKKYIATCFLCIVLPGCGEWENTTVGKASCSFGSFNDFIPVGRKPLKMASGNNGNNLYILDESGYVHTYERDNLYECAFNLKYSDYFSGIPNDVISSGNNFYVQDRAQLKSWENSKVCDARDGVFSVYENELAIGSNMGIETWSINPCVKKGNISSQKVLALAATGNEYYAVEGIATEPQNLAMFSKNGSFIYIEPISSTPGNEKNFCSADRVVANDYGVYILDAKCKKIGIFDNQAVWRKTVSLETLGIRNALDIAAGEYSYIFILHESGVEKVNAF
jgi:hypothetical protein